MKILTICGYSWEIGGPAKVIFDNTSVHLRLGAEVTILTPLWPGEKPYPVPEGARLVTVPRHPLARVLPEFSPQLYQYVRQHAPEYDLIHLHGLFHFGVLMPLALPLRARRVVTIHGILDPWALQKGAWKKRLLSALAQRRLLDRADLIHVFHAEEAAAVQQYLGHAPRRLAVIPNGMPLAAYQNLPAAGQFRQRYGLGADEKLILFLSRLNVKKGLDLLLPAFAQLAAQRPDVRLIVAGPDDGFQGYVENFVRDHRLENRVLLPGMLTGEAKLSAFRDADVFTLPSYSEGYSMAALEALATGTPALLSDRVGFGEALRQTGAARLSALTAEAVHDGLAHLLDHPAEASVLRQLGPRFVAQRADLDVVATQLYRQFEALMPR